MVYHLETLNLVMHILYECPGKNPIELGSAKPGIRICHIYLVALGGDLGLKTKGLNNEALAAQIQTLWKHRTDLDTFKRQYPSLFRIADRPVVPADTLGYYKFAKNNLPKLGWANFDHEGIRRWLSGLHLGWENEWEMNGTINV